MVALAFVIFGSAPLAFLPIFMQDHGFDGQPIVLLQMGPVIGGFSGLPVRLGCGRYGSKPVMQIGLAMKTLLPVAWLLMPRQSSASLAVAMGIAFIGVSRKLAGQSVRALFVRVVPYEKRAEYMAVYYALVGVWAALARSSAVACSTLSGISGSFLFTLDNFTPMFVGGLRSPRSASTCSAAQADSTVSVGAFAGMFVHGNPLQAFDRSLATTVPATNVRPSSAPNAWGSPKAGSRLMNCLKRSLTLVSTCV